MGLKFSYKNESPQCHTSEEVGSRGDLALLRAGSGCPDANSQLQPASAHQCGEPLFFFSVLFLYFFFKTSRMQSVGAVPSARRRTDVVPLVL